MSPQQQVDIDKNLRHVQQVIEDTCRDVGRDPNDIQLVVVTKEKSAAVIKGVIEAGVHKIGESYVQEATFKMDLLSSFDIEWHMIGHIQSGKSNRVVSQFGYIHSLDSLSLAEDLNRAASQWERSLPVLLECNMSGEESKYGWKAWDEDAWDSLADDLLPILEMSNIDVQGLMTMAPYHMNPEHSRPFFNGLKRFRDFLSDRFPEQDLSELSMGMSADYPIAIEEGATILRIGSAIVGPRR